MASLSQARSLAADLVELRRDLHQHPELSNEEVRTADLVTRRLERLGLQVRTGVAGTGVVADLDSGEGPRVALRADMDALPIHEDSEAPYASRVSGVMHACGHDAHTAALVGAAELLATEAREGALGSGGVRFLFQPCEESSDGEGRTGAQRMAEEGVLEGVDAVLAVHVGAHLDPGRVYLREGPLFAGSDVFTVDLQGRGAHGARPHEGVDAVVLAAQLITVAQQVVARRVEPGTGAVLGFGSVEAGQAPNVLADRARLEGTLRYFRPEERSRLREGLEGALRSVESMGAEGTLAYSGGPPPLVNDPKVMEVLRPALEDALGPEAVGTAETTTMAEDFAFLTHRVPGALLWVGAGLPERREHHHPRFDIDESCLPLAAAALATGARSLLHARAGERPAT